MTAKLPKAEIGFKRCALCKIDLKGRFVYIDDKTEELLGCSKEFLFGKSLLEFVGKSSQHLIKQLLSYRNHYETFYDTASIELINSRQKAGSFVKAIVSLNFIAGNPVNFQLIFDCGESPIASAAEANDSQDFSGVVSALADVDNYSNWHELFKPVLKLTGARAICLYLYSDGRLEPRTVVTDDNSADFVHKTIPEPTPFHLDLAREGREYSFLDQESVSRAVEKLGSAPNEYIAAVKLGRCSPFQIRLLFPENMEAKSAASAIARAQLVLRLYERILPLSENAAMENSDEIAGDVKFTIGFLDSLNLAAFLTDSEGNIVGYNPSLLQYVTRESLGGSYLELLQTASLKIPDGQSKELVEYLTADSSQVAADKVKFPVSLADGHHYELHVVKLGEGQGDLSACFVLVAPWKQTAQK